jgi:ATP-dependent Lon protease
VLQKSFCLTDHNHSGLQARRLDNDLKDLVIEKGGTPNPLLHLSARLSAAALHAQESGRPAVTGENTLLAIFAETRSPAARLLGEQGVSRGSAADFIARGVGNTPIS